LKESTTNVVRYRRHRRSRISGQTKFLVALLFAATAAITWQFARQQPVSTWAYTAPQSNISAPKNDSEDASKVGARQTYSSFVAMRPSRPSYLYSVVPGGVASAEELRQSMQNDPVVAREFDGFNFQRVHLVTVSENQSMHVAYRLGDKVYWTRKKVALHPGETLISDGKIVARTRCGNRIAMAPLGPPAIVEPMVSDFNQPLFSNDMVTHEAEPQPETYAAAIPSAPPVETNSNALQPAKGGRKIPFFILPVFGLPGLGGGGGSSHTPLAVAPEPGTMLLFSSGLVGVYWKSRKSRRKR
jgi:PEP-CTERM motif